MGASGWNYVTPWLGSPQRSLDALHREVFTAEEWDEEYASLEELRSDGEFMGTRGTHSVLDLTGAGDGARDDIRPLPPQRLLERFGTERPTVEQYALAAAGSPGLHAELHGRWTGRYVLLHTDGEPTHVGFFGVSGD
ncbi:hypothetical protein [Kitasatospora sp. NPDC057198]|uniref:hypothetical protein n=1 Tax=Kitasatospora sp. NPDC057198 TaxID=3346046 RepID=UPI003645BB05